MEQPPQLLLEFRPQVNQPIAAGEEGEPSLTRRVSCRGGVWRDRRRVLDQKRYSGATGAAPSLRQERSLQFLVTEVCGVLIRDLPLGKRLV